MFLRELVSNASDAIDKLRFLALTNPDLTKDDPVLQIRVKADKDAGTLTVSDNGIGMTLEEANQHLGTIAKSGTEEFLSKLSGDAAKDSQLIGQFGVGFYSAFVVADRVTVVSRSATAGADEAVRWTSDGNGTFESEPAHRDARGTDVILHLKDEDKSFLDEWTLRSTITKYSDHIATPVYLWTKAPEPADKKEDEVVPEGEWSQVNDAKALWTMAPKDVTEDQYKAFYKHLAHDYSDPLAWAHNRVEGDLEYTSLLYLPSEAPWDLYSRDHQQGLKLFVQRVFIMDEDEQFLPSYLRFVRGLIDTNALPLNVSREILQDSRVTRKLKSALTKRALGMIEKLSANKEEYSKFVANFNNVLKEGISEQSANQEQLLKLIRFASTKDTSSSKNVSLEDYVKNMKEGQKHIYFLCAEDYDKAVNSPYLERLKAKDIEVLLMWDQPIDSWFSSFLREFQGKSFVSATSEDLDLGDLENEQDKQAAEEAQKSHEDLIKRFKDALGEQVADVKVTTLLNDSPACLVTSNAAFSFQMKMMAKMQGMSLPEDKGVLELNPNHPLVQKAYAEQNESVFKDYAELIFLQASLSEQGQVKNPSAFVALMNRLLLGTSAAAADAAAAAPAPAATNAAGEAVEVEVVEPVSNKDDKDNQGSGSLEA